jgi:opacity protein-like surface antigen
MKTLCLFVVSALVLAGGAQAATAAFQGNCVYSGSNASCTFDSARPASNPTSCPGSYVYFYCWDFGDGTTQCPSGSSSVTHTYTAPLAAGYTPKLTITCADGNQASDTNSICVSVGIPGCIYIDGVWAGH